MKDNVTLLKDQNHAKGLFLLLKSNQRLPPDNARQSTTYLINTMCAL